MAFVFLLWIYIKYIKDNRSNLELSILIVFIFLFVQEQNSKHLDEHRETDEMSEKTSPKNLKSPQKGSKRLKTISFKVTLLDSSEFEGEIEVCVMDKQFAATRFLDLAFNMLWANHGKEESFFLSFIPFVVVVIFLFG